LTALNLEDELAIQEGGWRGRFITFGILLIAGAFALAGIWYYVLREETETVRATEDYTVVKATISSNLLITGTADAQLNSDLTFQGAGKVGAVNVRVGDVVKQGQVLASLVSEDLENGVRTAQANQAAAQLRLDDLLDGSSSAELAAAQQGVASAEAALTKAENDYNDLLDGPDATEVAAADQAVRLAESQLAAANATREKLENTPSDADVAAAEAGVASATAALEAAENTADSAQNGVESARLSVLSAGESYCLADPSPSFCPSGAAPISSADLAILHGAVGGANSTQATTAITANNSYLSAQNSAESAEAAIASAQDALASAEARLDLVEQGPTAEEMDAAEAGVASAEAGLFAAVARLSDLNDGASAEELANSQTARDSALASLDAAQERLAEARRGPESNAISQAQAAVRSAALAVEAAEIRLRNAQIIAPFDGTIAAVNISPGEFSSGASTAGAPIVMLTPDTMILTLDIEETDYPNVKIDQGGVALFDGIPGGFFPFRITAIGLSPTTTQGVITYEAKAVLVLPADGPRPAPGMNANGQLTTTSKADILVVPPRALRRRGSEQVVDVRRNGVIEEQVVVTGVSDNNNVEIVSGLAEGDVVVVPSIAGGDGPAGGGPTPVPTISSGIR
jgi:RND family efflux transporter MFP subunit